MVTLHRFYCVSDTATVFAEINFSYTGDLNFYLVLSEL